MALIKCPECGKDISDKAKSCPNCGYEINTVRYGEEIGTGIKTSIKGLNTTASPKKREICIKLIIIPLILFLVFFSFGILIKSDGIASIGIVFGLCLGMYQFYIGKFKKGLIYTITMGGIVIGCLIDLFQLVVTHTLKDSNGFPIIY